MKEGFRVRDIFRIPRRAVGLAGIAAILAVGCSAETTVDNTPPSRAQREFYSRANATLIRPGETLHVERVIDELGDLYDRIPVVDQRNAAGADIDNPLSSKPYRYEMRFSEGDGSGSDSVCEDLRVPKDMRVKYVRAVTNSNEDAWVAFDEDKKEVHICFDDDNHPEDIVVWGDYRPR